MLKVGSVYSFSV